MDNKVKTLENVISDLKISDDELQIWYQNRQKAKTDAALLQAVVTEEAKQVKTILKKPEDVIVTDIPLVYYDEAKQTLSIEPAFDLNRKKELFGVYFSCGLVLGLNIKFNSDGISFENALDKAVKLKCDGISGCLPAKDVQMYLTLISKTEEYNRFINTIKILHSNGVKAACWDGDFWCCERGNTNNNFCLELTYDNRSFKLKRAENEKVSRFAVFFDFNDKQKEKFATLPLDNDYLVKTACSLVYLNRQSNQICIKSGLDLNKKDTLWGIQLATGEIVELCRKCRSYEDAYNIVSKLSYFDFKTLNFVSENEIKSLLSSDISAMENDFNKTVETLAQYGIKADKFGGRCWLNEREDYKTWTKYSALTSQDFWAGQNDYVDIVSLEQDDFVDRIVLQKIVPRVKTPYPVIYLLGNDLFADEYLRMEYINRVFGAMLAPRMVVRFTDCDDIYLSGREDRLRFYGKTGYNSNKKLDEIDTADFNSRVEQMADIFEKYGIEIQTMSSPSADCKRIGSYSTFFF